MDWTNKKVLVTGAGGFIGSHLVERLVALGAQTHCFVHYNSMNNWGWLDYSPCKGQLDVIPGDIRDRDSVRSAVKGVSIIFHLAALIGIPYSYHAPASYVDTNIHGTLNVLQAAREASIEKVIHTSTSEVYGSPKYVPMDEQHPLQAQSPYSASKIAADQLTLSYYLSFGTPVTIVRPFNTFGPRQSARAIIPTIISQSLKSSQIKLGSLFPVRDMSFVEDTVSGFIAVAESENALGEVINIGQGVGNSIKDIAANIFRILGRDIDIIEDKQRVRPERSEIGRLICDNKKATRLTGWRPKYGIEKGLSITVEWIAKHVDLYQPKDYVT